MKDFVLQLFEQYPQIALLISLLISVLIAVAGILPSVFVTAANILFFGFWQGMLVSFIGEALGAAVAFFLYRKGFKKRSRGKLHQFPKVQKLIDAKGSEAFLLILSLRLLPFVPSGLVTFAASIGSVSFLTFIIASSLGKVPALLIEAYSVEQVINFSWQGKLILSFVALVLLFMIIKKVLSRQKNL